MGYTGTHRRASVVVRSIAYVATVPLRIKLACQRLTWRVDEWSGYHAARHI